MNVDISIINVVSLALNKGVGGFISQIMEPQSYLPAFISERLPLNRFKDFYYRKLCFCQYYNLHKRTWPLILDNIISIDFAAIYFYPIRIILEKIRLLTPIESNHRLKEAAAYNNQSFNISFGHRVDGFNQSFIVQITDIQYKTIMSKFLDYFLSWKPFIVSPAWLKYLNFFKVIIE
jgi:hypothetical protein